LLMPSRFEPCGLNQMIAMRYGSIPIVRHVGGLIDTVEDYDPTTGTGTGFVFEKFDPMALVIATTRAYEHFRDKKVWRRIQKRAMERDFSWKNSAKEYLRIFDLARSFHEKEEN